jgi:inner membrane protein
MNIVTHGLASLALVRAAWPRAPKELWIVAVGAGVIADVDFTSAWFGASAYLTWHRTCTHALLTSLVVAVAFAAGYRIIADDALRARFSVRSAFTLALAAEGLHLLMDVGGWEGAALLWPFSAKRLAMDLLADLDPWIVAVLLVALLFPELLHLVGAEIGARDPRPRGRIGSLIGFAIIVFYVAARAHFHSDVIALMESRTFQGEIAKRTGAFPEAFSPVTWHGIVETERALHQLTVMVGPVESFDPESADILFKPQQSAALDAAEKTEAAKRFLTMAQFPKASVEGTPTGSRVEIRDLRYAAVGETGHEVIAVMALDAANRVVADRIAWARHDSQE